MTETDEDTTQIVSRLLAALYCVNISVMIVLYNLELDG
jgi:hypothetical protein